MRHPVWPRWSLPQVKGNRYTTPIDQNMLPPRRRAPLLLCLALRHPGRGLFYGTRPSAAKASGRPSQWRKCEPARTGDVLLSDILHSYTSQLWASIAIDFHLKNKETAAVHLLLRLHFIPSGASARGPHPKFVLRRDSLVQYGGAYTQRNIMVYTAGHKGPWYWTSTGVFPLLSPCSYSPPEPEATLLRQ